MMWRKVNDSDKFTIACEEAVLAINEFVEAYQKIKNSYHPFVWWLYEKGILK